MAHRSRVDPEEATGTVGVSEDGNSAILEDFISKIMRISCRLLWISRLIAVELTLSSSTPLLSFLRLRHIASGEAIAKSSLSRPSS